MRLATAIGAAVLLSLSVSATTLHAEDTLKKWQFGIGFSYWSTDDNIRSNSATAYAPVDPSQGGNLPPIIFSDPRPDANELNEPTIQDSFKLDFQASFGLTRWVSLQLDSSYFKGDVGSIEFYSEDQTVPISLTQTPPNPDDGLQPPNPLDPTQKICSPTDGSTPPAGSKPCYNLVSGTVGLVKRNAFMPVGSITEVPVSLSGVVRFRPESPFDPYVGAGVGYIFANLDTAASSIGTPVVLTASDSFGTNRVVNMKGFNDVQDFTNGLIVNSIQSGARGILTYPCVQADCSSAPPTVFDSNGTPLGTPLTALTATVDSAPEFHLMGGVDYYFSSRWSMYVDARYVWAESKVKVRIDRQTQILSGIKDYGCVNATPGSLNPQFCRSVNLGDKDITNAVLLNPTVDDVQDLIIIQGGDIRLGGFSIGIGAKVTF